MDEQVVVDIQNETKTGKRRISIDEETINDVIDAVHPGLSDAGKQDLIESMKRNPETLSVYYEMVPEARSKLAAEEVGSYTAALEKAQGLLGQTWMPEDMAAYARTPVLAPLEVVSYHALRFLSPSRAEGMLEEKLPAIREAVRDEAIIEWTSLRDHFLDKKELSDEVMSESSERMDGLYGDMLKAKHTMKINMDARKRIPDRKEELAERLEACREADDYEGMSEVRAAQTAVRRDGDIYDDAIEAAAHDAKFYANKLVMERNIYQRARWERQSARSFYHQFEDVVRHVELYDEQSETHSSPEFLLHARANLEVAQKTMQVLEAGHGALFAAMRAAPGAGLTQYGGLSTEGVEGTIGREEEWDRMLDAKVAEAYDVIETVERLHV